MSDCESPRSRTRGAGSVTWIATFADSGTEYIAIGRDRNRIAVFRSDCALGGPIMERLATTFLGRLRFLPGALSPSRGWLDRLVSSHRDSHWFQRGPS